jgi:spore coat protein A, manganese oxidase
VLQLGVLGSAALVLPTERLARTALQQAARLDPARLPAVGSLPFRVPPVAAPTRTTVTVPANWIDPRHPAGNAFVPVEVDYYESRMRQDFVPMHGIHDVPPTMIWAYYQGTKAAPTIHSERGRPVIVRHYNDLAEQHPVLRYGPPQTSVHLHGNPSLPQHDGYASDTTSAGRYKDYWYPMFEDARTLWYHDHGVHQTGPNAYMGLAAQWHLHDHEERDSGLPLASQRDCYDNPYDVPVTIRDAMFDSDGQLIFDDNFESSAFGDVMLVNGVPWPRMPVEPRKYRLRFLNAAVSRSVELALTVEGSTARIPLTVVGTDGGLMEIAQSTPRIRMGMAERYEVVIDFKDYEGRRLVLRNLRPPNNLEFPTTGVIMEFEVGGKVKDAANNTVGDGTVLRSRPETMALTETPSTVQRTLRFVRDGGHWTINNKTWDDVVASNFQATLANPTLDAVEVWTLRNPSGGWFHPVHIHLVDFKILSRTGVDANLRGVQPYERGPKDVVYVGENETVKVIAHFGPQAGRYMIHCHNLVHEDHDMMHQFWVRSPDGSRPDYDPMGFRASQQPANGALNLPPTPDGQQQHPPSIV